MQTCYKVTTSTNKSHSIIGNESIQYIQGKFIKPPIGKVFVFATLEAAKAYDCSSPIWLAQTSGKLKRQRRRLSLHALLTTERLKAFWVDRKPLYDDEFLSCNFYVAPNLKLIKRIR